MFHVANIHAAGHLLLKMISIRLNDFKSTFPTNVSGGKLHHSGTYRDQHRVVLETHETTTCEFCHIKHVYNSQMGGCWTNDKSCRIITQMTMWATRMPPNTSDEQQRTNWAEGGDSRVSYIWLHIYIRSDRQAGTCGWVGPSATRKDFHGCTDWRRHGRIGVLPPLLMLFYFYFNCLYVQLPKYLALVGSQRMCLSIVLDICLGY